jgi:hypothetical protein
MSMERPNGQQISKQEIAERGEKGHNARWMFGPPPGWEWYSADGRNLELAIPAYEADEMDLIWVFEHPNDPPYHGSYHLVIAELVFPNEWRSHPGTKFKDDLPLLYRRVKNGNFARQYGAQKRKVDGTFGVAGAFDLVSGRFPKIDRLARGLVDFANRNGWVETIPDSSVDPNHGYPILITREERGFVKPTLPMSYHTSGTACWWMLMGQTRCYDHLRQSKSGGKMILQVHDELVFAFPTANGSVFNQREMAKLKAIMEKGGDGIGVVTPVSVEHHPDNWEQGTEVEFKENELAVAQQT